jgi:uncharacterized protein YjbJ (UPF0337 family)
VAVAPDWVVKVWLPPSAQVLVAQDPVLGPRALRLFGGNVVPAVPLQGRLDVGRTRGQRTLVLWPGPRRLDHTGGAHDEEGWYAMNAKSDQIKGHAKEAAGVLTGDKDLESEGKTDRRTGEAEEKIDHAKDKVDEVIDKTKDALHRK